MCVCAHRIRRCGIRQRKKDHTLLQHRHHAHRENCWHERSADLCAKVLKRSHAMIIILKLLLSMRLRSQTRSLKYIHSNHSGSKRQWQLEDFAIVFFSLRSWLVSYFVSAHITFDFTTNHEYFTTSFQVNHKLFNFPGQSSAWFEGYFHYCTKTLLRCCYLQLQFLYKTEILLGFYRSHNL